MFRRLVLIAVLVSSTFCQTPVIGGTCKLGTADVQIGGKQTQFFLKCETTADSAQGEGVWVVKSRAAATAAAATSSSSAAAAAAAPSVVPVENTQPQQHPKARKPVSPNICEQDNGARENEACAVSATCLQAHNELPSSYLQCDQAGLRWIRKSCQDGFIFNFEQQTCIVPKRMSSLSRKLMLNDSLNSLITNHQESVSDDPCLKCSLGSACRHGVCYPLTTSNLCSDGSPPNGTCSTIKKCPNQHFCTAQNVCCPQTALSSSIGCQLVCRIDEDREDQCPHGFSCQNNCCEPRKILRHPISRQEDGFYDGGGVENQVSSSSIQLESCAQKSPDFSTKCGGTNANCSSDDDCPTSFKCDKFACCRLAICPRTDTPARFTCTNQYHCRSNERCIFGACCPNFSDAAQPSNQSIGVVGSTPIIRQQSVASASCDVDDRVKYCDIEHVCPEMSECIAGICCRLPPMSKCGNGLMALSIPARCQLSDECPIASRCEYGKCCPFETESQTNDDDVVDDENQQLEILETNEVVVEEASTTSSPKGISIRKSTCLTSHQCDLHQLCPPQFTCSLAGKCCDLKVLCPDGTVPESSCNHHDNCPSSSHKCLLLNNEHRACCYMPQLRTTDDSTSDSSSDCPAGSKEVDPKFGASCRYSLQCPSPYFCNQKGKCCEAIRKHSAVVI